MECQSIKYDCNQRYVHNVPASDYISLANERMVELAEEQTEHPSIAEQRVGAIIEQAAARKLLGRASGGFLRRKEKSTPSA